VLLLLLLCAGKCTDNTEDPYRLPAAIAGMVGSILGAMGIVISAMAELTLHNDILTKLAFGLAIAAAAALLAVAYCRSKALRPNVLLHAVIAVYLLFRLINQYRHWSSDPQLQDYCFQLLATVFVMLAAYHRGAFDVGIGKHRPYIFFHLAAVFCCFLSLTDKACIAFYIGCGIWMMTDLIPASVPDVPQEES